MTNQKRLEEYLVGNVGKNELGYLQKDISNGKVIMLSGKWGSGKTHFWQNIIAKDKFKKDLSDKGSAYSYISLYGKSSIEEIENDIFGQIYFSAIGGENIVTKTFSTFTKYSKRYGNLFSSFDFSKLADGLKEEQKDNKERVALERLKNGAIICFDDFERKSKDIDLNDLFGFITQLTLNFNCKVVIILNDDVFEDEEKKIFSNVKEKSVSKFLKYGPKIEDLFNLIFNEEIEKDGTKEKKYKELESYREIILKTIEETEELNARIYIQVLDNLSEWIDKEKEKSDKVLRCLILVNIYFILYHTIFTKLENNNYLTIKGFTDKLRLDSNSFDSRTHFTLGSKDDSIPYKSVEEYLNSFEKRILIGEKIDINQKYIEENKKLYISKFFANRLVISKNIDDKTFQEINNFIETGILINE